MTKFIQNIHENVTIVIVPGKYIVHVIEATSDKYIINETDKYIYTGTDTDSETILSNINLNYDHIILNSHQCIYFCLVCLPML